MPDVDNITFFRIVDKQVREAMQQVETEMLPVAQAALSEAGLSLQKYPVEGYYSKTPELTQYSHHMKTLQLNSSDTIGDAILTLHDFYTNEVFGLGQAVRTAINEEGVWYPKEDPVVISPMVDPLTVAIDKVGNNVDTVKQDVTIENIAKALEDVEIGKGLVGFGSLVDKVEREETGVYNPIATTLARETTVLSAYVPRMRSMSKYKVSPEVEAQGNVVIDAYNALFKKANSEVSIPNVTKDNARRLNKDLPEMDRCVRIFNVELPEQEIEFYHWAIGKEDNSPKVIDFWSKEVITTDMFKKEPEQYQKQKTA